MASKHNTPWSSAENHATVEAYFEYWLGDQGTWLTKVDVYRDLHARFPRRSAKAFEFKFQNVSGVLFSRGREFMEGLKPRVNFQSALEVEVLRFINARPDLDAAIGRANRPPPTREGSK